MALACVLLEGTCVWGGGLSGAQTLAALQSQERVAAARGTHPGDDALGAFPGRLDQTALPALFTGKFLADNIVGSVLVFSLLVWIPLSILVHCVVSHHS